MDPKNKATQTQPVDDEDGFYIDDDGEIAYNPNADPDFFDITSGGAD